MSRIILCGARTIGKTTLCEDWCEENQGYGRIDGNDVTSHVMDELDISRDDVTQSMGTSEKELFFKLQKSIFIEQNKRETTLQDQPYISDSGPDALVYTFIENKELSYQLFEEESVKSCFSIYRSSLVVVVSPLEDDRAKYSYTESLEKVLQQCGVSYMYLRETDKLRRLYILKQAALLGCVPISLEQFKKQLCLTYYIDKTRTCQTPIPVSTQVPTACSIRMFTVYTNEIVLSSQVMHTSNRMIARYGEDNFVLINFHWKVGDTDVEVILNTGVYVDGEEYQFIGCSCDGLKNRTCYLMKGNCDYIDGVLSECGDLSEVNSVFERLKSIGLLFSGGFNAGVTVGQEDTQVIEDISGGGGIFTDGYGFIGDNLAKKLAIAVTSSCDYPPAVFQIVFQGYKGVVMKNSGIDQDSLQVRNSMSKFNSGSKPFPEIWVCKQCRPYTYGNLSKQLIVVLFALGVSDEMFCQIQYSYFYALESILLDCKFASKLANWKNHSDLSTQISACKDNEEMRENVEIQNKLKYLRNILVCDLTKFEVPVIQSRFMLAVCDPVGVLEYGECYIRYSCNNNVDTIKADSYVMVVKHPSYRLTDVRVLTAVDYPELSHLVDCIVIPMKGKWPLSSEITRPHLDRDEYFVCWDEKLIPFPLNPQCPPVGEAQSQNLSREGIITFFSGYKESIDLIDTSYHQWADKSGAECKECGELAQLFTRYAESAKKVQIPFKLKSPPSDSHSVSSQEEESILVKMERLSQDKKRIYVKNIIEEAMQNEISFQSIPEKFVVSLLEEKRRYLPEYKLLLFLYKWCTTHASTDRLIQLSYHIQFGKLTLNERIQAIHYGIPIGYIINVFTRSKILTNKMVHSPIIEIPFYGWQWYLSEKSSNMDWGELSNAITGYSECFIILQLQECRLAFHLIGPIKAGVTVIPAGALTSYLFSNGQVMRYVTECSYNLNLTADVIQFYIGEIQNTFLFLKRFGRSSKNDFEGVKYDIVSIELAKFKPRSAGKYKHPLIRKQNFYSIEVFVKNGSLDLDVNDSNRIEDGKQFEVEESCINELLTLSDAPMSALEELARSGDCLGFSDVIQHITGDLVLVKVTELFLVLISSIFVKFEHETYFEEYYSEEESSSQMKSITEEVPNTFEIEQCVSEVQEGNLLDLELDSQTETSDNFKNANPFIDELEQEPNAPPLDSIVELTDVVLEQTVSTWEKFRETAGICLRQTTHSEIAQIYSSRKLSAPVMEEIEVGSENTELQTNPFLDMDNLDATTTTTTINSEASLETNPFASVSSLESPTIATTNIENTSEDAPFIHGDLINLQTTTTTTTTTIITTTTDINSSSNNCNLNQQIEEELDPSDTLESLKDLLNSPLIQIAQPRDVLHLYSTLSKLQLYDVITQHFDKSINKVNFSTITQYSECVSNWNLWTFLPQEISNQLSSHFYTLSLALDCVKKPDMNYVGITVPNSIQELSVSDTPPPAVDDTILNYYKCYFYHLTLNNLLYYTSVGEDMDIVGVFSNEEDLHINTHLQCSNGTMYEIVKNKKNWRVRFSRNSEITSNNFTPGSYVKINFSSECIPPLALGYITAVSNSPATITLDILDPVPDCLKHSVSLQLTSWRLSLLGDVTAFVRSNQALQNIENSKIISILTSPEAFPPPLDIAQEHRVELSAKSSDLIAEVECIINPYDTFPGCVGCDQRTVFSQDQENAIFSALRQTLTLIHGPPGTGKTVIAAEIAHQLCHLVKQDQNRDDKLKILVTADTDLTVDNITYKLLALGMLVLRVGKVSEDLREHSLEFQVRMKQLELGQFKNESFQKANLIDKIIKSADIIATTCSGAGDDVLRNIQFPYIVIDEATQVLEPVSLIPIIKSCKKLILIGDVQQLIPAFNNTATQSEITPPISALRVSLFHRLHAKMESIFLHEQYRMHPVVAEFPSRIFYSGELKSVVSEDDRILPEISLFSNETPVRFFNVESQEIESDGSWKNPGEAERVVEIVKELIATKCYKLCNIGVITPYSGQVQCIRDLLKSIKVDVQTIEDFQGMEREVIVFSTVRNGQNSDLSLVTDPNRIIILLTRAKRALVGVGSYNTLRLSDIWSEWVSLYSEKTNIPASEDTEGSIDW